MALKEVANTSAVLSYSAPVTGPPATFTGPPSTKVKAGGSFVHLDGVQVTIPSGVTDGTCTTTVPGIGNMTATASKVEGEGKPVIRKDDELTVNGITGVLSGGGACTLNVTVKVSNAGQTKVTAQ
jgi:hypothetical protein